MHSKWLTQDEKHFRNIKKKIKKKIRDSMNRKHSPVSFVSGVNLLTEPLKSLHLQTVCVQNSRLNQFYIIGYHKHNL